MGRESVADPKLIMQTEDLRQFLKSEFPQLNDEFEIVQTGNRYCIVQFEADEKHLRPGGTVSGPALFALADIAAYAAILAHIGPVALAVTTNLNINFLRKPAPGLIQGNAKILKLGKRLAVIEISITAGKKQQLVAHAIATYSLPPR